MNSNRKIIEEDIEFIFSELKPFWDELRGKNIFITGGTGFVGRWLLESFVFANNKLNLGAKAFVLTRNPDIFMSKAPGLCKEPCINLCKGDVRNFNFPTGEFSHIIHAAAESSTNLNETDPLLMFDTIVNGTHRTLEFAVQAKCRKFLFVSSGAAYGKQPTELSHIPETYMGGPDTMNPSSAYGEGKRAGELLCAIYHKKFPSLEPKIARCFAFVGPFLPLDAHFAVGNFIRDVLNDTPIIIKGDGTPLRSYMYAADLAIWLWTILFKGNSCEIYNVGSDREISIFNLAKTLLKVTYNKKNRIEIKKELQKGRLINKYIPSIELVRTKFYLKLKYNVNNAIKRTYCFYAERKKQNE